MIPARKMQDTQVGQLVKVKPGFYPLSGDEFKVSYYNTRTSLEPGDLVIVLKTMWHRPTGFRPRDTLYAQVLSRHGIEWVCLYDTDSDRTDSSAFQLA